MKRKLERFKIIEKRENVVERTKNIFEKIKGNWQSDYFKNANPITVELGCGRGEYRTALATLFPDRNFIGVDVKGERIWKGSTLALEQNLTNVAFLRTPILQMENFFAPHEIDEVWTTFPDPRPKKKRYQTKINESKVPGDI